MKMRITVVWVLSAVLVAGLARAQTAGEAPANTACEVSVPLTPEAEKRMGGALYEGTMESGEAMPGMMEPMPGMSEAMPEEAGAHAVHGALHGGAFFMAPNKIHHVEGKYSKQCGMQLFLYNAFREPISVERFQAFFQIIPEDEAEWDKQVIRFLSPVAGGAILQARGDHEIKGPFKIELYVKFPESDDAELFNIPTEQSAH